MGDFRRSDLEEVLDDVPITGGGLPRTGSPSYATAPSSREMGHKLPELYATVGVLGAQGVGKSSLISELLGIATKYQG